MARRRAPRWLPLMPLLLQTAAAAGMSLSNFQLITSTSVPLSCILAYNQPLAGCTVGDFTQGGPGATCSQACQRGIQATQNTLQSACADSGAPVNSVLGQALLGNLVTFLCGGAPSKSTAFTRATQASTAAVELPAPSSEISSADDVPPDPTPVQVQPPPTPETPTPLYTPTDTTGARQTKTPSPPKQPQSDSTRGGGSPFDEVVNGSADLAVDWRQFLLLALAISLALLR